MACLNTFRQNLQVEYSKRLINIVGYNGNDNAYDYRARAAALNEIERIESWMKRYSKKSGQSATDATRRYILHLIDQGLDREA